MIPYAHIRMVAYRNCLFRTIRREKDFESRPKPLRRREDIGRGRHIALIRHPLARLRVFLLPIAAVECPTFHTILLCNQHFLAVSRDVLIEAGHIVREHRPLTLDRTRHCGCHKRGKPNYHLMHSYLSVISC